MQPSASAIESYGVLSGSILDPGFVGSGHDMVETHWRSALCTPSAPSASHDEQLLHRTTSPLHQWLHTPSTVTAMGRVMGGRT
eukprot:6458341-Amphidinium_carterae.1